MFDLLCTQTDGIQYIPYPHANHTNELIVWLRSTSYYYDGSTKTFPGSPPPPGLSCLLPLSCKQSSIFFWNTWFNRGNNNPWWCCLIYWLEFEFFSVGMRVMLIANVCHQQSILKEGCWHQSCLQTTRAPRTPSAQP